MKKLTMLLITLLFAVGTYFSTASTLASETTQERADRPCVHHCRENFEDAARRCRELPPAQREHCLREARERERACVRNCRD